MAWFKKEKTLIASLKESDKTVRTEGLWMKCGGCRQIIWKKDLDANEHVCPKCDHHFKLHARARLGSLFDDGKFETFHGDMLSPDPLNFVDRRPYAEKLQSARKSTGLNDAVINAVGMWLIGLAGGYVIALTDVGGIVSLGLVTPLGARGFWMGAILGMAVATLGIIAYFVGVSGRQVARARSEGKARASAAQATSGSSRWTLP
jgi:hypothetical protein